MFYDTSRFQEKLEGGRDDRTHGIVVITPSESRRLLAKGVLALPEVQRSLKDGLFVICRGITTAFVAEEVLGDTLNKPNCTAGIVTDGRLASTLPEEGQGPWVFRDGDLTPDGFDQALKDLTATDVVVKGVNAVDAEGNVGVIAANWVGGTIGAVWPTVTARGTNFVIPVGLEKLIPSVNEAVQKCGQGMFKYVMGAKIGLMPVMQGLVVTEIEALAMLTGVSATHVASGGVGGSEGSVIISLEGSDETVKRAFELVKSIKGEPPVPQPNLLPALIS